MRSNSWIVSCLLAGGVFLFFGGCGASSHPQTASVQGKVVWQGKPLPDGVVWFNPLKIAEGLPKRPARGAIGPDGVYRLATFSKGDGVVPGEYCVTVQSYAKEPVEGEPVVWRIPERYGDPTRSGLSFVIPADAKGTLTYDIEIK